MMRLSTMWKVDRTVDASGSSPVAERILEHWNYDPGSIRFFRSSSNFLYVFQSGAKRLFLRFADGSERSRETIEDELDIVNRVAGMGIPVAIPVISMNSNYVETVVTEIGTFHAVVFTELEGTQFELEELEPAQFQAWGAALGRLHTALKSYPDVERSSRPSWLELKAIIQAQIPPDAPELQRELDDISSLLSTLPVDHDSYGPIHFDFQPDNLVWTDKTIATLDYDDCARFWYVADIAFALQDLFEDGVDLSDRSFLQFVRGYRAHCPLHEQMLEQIPVFLRFDALFRYARLSRVLDLAEDQEYPEWLSGLTRKFQNRTESYRQSPVT